jgi:hypothetical protein
MTEAPEPGPPEHGELGDEIHRLVSAVQDWTKRAFAEPVGGSAHPGPTECLPWCPICQFAQVLRGDHPEVGERVAEAGTAIANAIKALADAAVTRAQPGEAESRSRPKPPPRVQHIRLDDPTDS